MDQESKFQISKEFKLKVFRNEDIKDLIEIFRKSYNDISESNSELELIIHYKDGMSFTARDEKVLKDTEMIDRLSFELINYKNYKKMEISISENRGIYKIAGYEEDWVRAKSNSLEEYLKKVQNQSKILSNFGFYILLSSIFSLIILTSLLNLFSNNFFKEKFEDNFELGTTFGILIFIFNYAILVFLSNKIHKLYPNLEFDTTRDYMNKRKKLKRILFTISGTIVTGIFLPILLDYLLK